MHPAVAYLSQINGLQCDHRAPLRLVELESMPALGNLWALNRLHVTLLFLILGMTLLAACSNSNRCDGGNEL